MIKHRWLVALAALVLLAGCDTWFGSNTPPLPGKRVSVLAETQALAPDASAYGQQIILPEPEKVPNWPNAGGFAPHSMLHLTLGPNPQRVRTADIGAGSGKRQAVLAQPIVANGRVFAMDSESVVTAWRLRDGQRLWKIDLTTRDLGDSAYGGGLAFDLDLGALYATTGFAQVVRLNPNDGTVVWRHSLRSPSRGAPTTRSGRVFAITVENETVAINGEDGAEIWRHVGLEEPATLMGAASVGVNGNLVVVPYRSGEVYALRIENGSVLWNDALAAVRRSDQISTLPTILALPVIEGDRLYTIGHADFLVSFDARNGQRLWEKEIGGTQTPWLAGDYLYLISNSQELVCLEAATGRLVWVRPLPQWRDSKKRTGRIFWTGPVLGSDRLIVASTIGWALAVSPYNGRLLGRIRLPDGVTIAPVLADDTLIFVTDGGTLVAYR